MRKRLQLLAGIGAAFAVFATNATASEWGCEVLLCASSSAPPWQGIPSCHPPMEKLLLAMAGWSFSWPICPEAGTAAPGYEKYEPCKDGYTAIHTGDDYGSSGASDANTCVKIVDVCKSRGGMTEETGSCNQIVDHYARKVRDNPYYFDLKSTATGQTTRRYFNLNN